MRSFRFNIERVLGFDCDTEKANDSEDEQQDDQKLDPCDDQADFNPRAPGGGGNM